MSNQYDGGPAFPSNDDGIQNEGMTLRDWFAGQALAGRAQFLQPGVVLYPDCIARECYLIADAMLKARGGAS
jgi:hypothetical protein